MAMFCLKCDKEVETYIVAKPETYSVKGIDITIDANVCVCSVCGEELLHPDVDDENLKKAYNLYRKERNLLFPDEIKSIREKYNLSQTSFAKIIGVGEKTITRYENGSLQDEAQNNLILLMRNPRAFKELYERNKERLALDEIMRLDAFLPKLIDSIAWTTSGKQYYKYKMDNCDTYEIDYPA